MGHFHGFLTSNQAATIGTPKYEYIDNDFRGFLADLYQRHSSSMSTYAEYDGIMNGAMQGATGTVLAYLEDTYEVIDETVLEDIRSCLFKIFAFQCGTHLGACYIRGADSTKIYLDEINKELSKGI